MLKATTVKTDPDVKQFIDHLAELDGVSRLRLTRAMAYVWSQMQPDQQRDAIRQSRSVQLGRSLQQAG